MSYPSAYYNEAQQIIDKRRQANGALQDKRELEVRSKIPKAGEIIEELAGTIGVLAHIISEKPADLDKQVEQLKDRNLYLQQQLAELLKNNGYPADYLDSIYTCELCHDTGIAADGRCKCFKDLLKQIASKNLSESISSGVCGFDEFDLTLYPEQPSPSLGGLSPREIMTQNFNFCKDYAEDFHLPCGSVFMSGGTGLGKTHLSVAIAQKVIDKGYSVVYGSAPDILRKIENEHFDRDSSDDVLSVIKECDLLVFDDLGSEFDTPFYISTICEIINSRLNFGRPSIISTNLSSADIAKRYSDRIASRLLSMKNLYFTGKDIRVSKGKV